MLVVELVRLSVAAQPAALDVVQDMLHFLNQVARARSRTELDRC